MDDIEDSEPFAGAPHEDAVRIELERVLASPYFQQAERASAFLRFAVEETLAGRAARLKGYSIAIEVFGRPEDFDAGADPLVRVEAGRLRRRLSDYYANQGRDDPVRIDLPVGGYVAHFSSPRASEPEVPAATAEKAVRSRPRPAVVAGSVALAVALALALAVIGWLPHALQSSSAENPGEPVLGPQFAPTPGPTIAVTGFTNLSDDAGLDAFAAGLTEELLVRLGAFSLSVVPASATQSSNKAVALYGASGAATTGYILTGSVRPDGTGLRISARLVDGRSGAQVWTATLDTQTGTDTAGLLASEEHVATEIAATVSSPFGPLYEHEIERIGTLPLDSLDAYGCIVLFRAYAKSLDPETHGESRRCFLNVITHEPQTAQSWAGLALLYQHEYWYGYGPETDAGTALDRAREAAQTALDIDGDNLLANLAMAGLRYTEGDADGFHLAVQKAMSLHTNPGTFAQVGLLMILAGKTRHGVKMLDWGFTKSGDVPSWYHIGYCFDALLAGDYAAALGWAHKIDTPNWFATSLAEAASAGLAGDRDVAMRSVNRLLALKPDFDRTGYARLHAWIRNDELVGVLVEGLRRAGLELGDAPARAAPTVDLRPPNYGLQGAPHDLAR